MNNNLITIVALSVDTRHAVLYKQDGSTLTIPQGDARLPRIVEMSKPFLSEGMPSLVDITPIVPIRTEFNDAEKGTGGVVKFFKVAKSFLKKLINTESPEEVPKEVAHISPLDIGVFPGKDVINQGTKEESEAPQEAVSGLSAPLSQEEAEDKQARLGQDATTGQTPVTLSNQEKLAAAQARMRELTSNSVGTDQAEFHTEVKESETIVAVHATTGAIIPDAHKMARQLRAAQKLQDYTGFTKFVERLAAIIDERGHSVEDLMQFIEHGDLPIADDGCIVGYKRLRNKDGVFVDCHTNKVTQKVGSFVFMRPGLVDPNRRQDCSNGLHVGTIGYMSSFSGDVTTMIKVRPEDVFAVPEHDNTKMRVAGYHIVAELPPKLRDIVNTSRSISIDPEGAKLLDQVLRGEHIGVIQLVEIGGHNGTNLTITDVGSAPAVVEDRQHSGAAETLNMEEQLVARAPTAPAVVAADLVQKDEPLHPLLTDEEDSSDETSITVIMSNDPKDTSGEETKPVQKLSRAKSLYAIMTTDSSETIRAEAAYQLRAHKKEKRKSWSALGLVGDIDAEISALIDRKPTDAAPVNAPKAVKPQSTPVAAKGKPADKVVANVMAALKDGLSQREVAQKFGLSKDQVYRLVKKYSV